MFHVNPLTGAVGRCKATKNCPFGDMATEHYVTPHQARAAYEASMEKYTLLTLAKKDFINLPEKDEVVKALMSAIEVIPNGDQKNILSVFTKDFTNASQPLDYEMLFSIGLHLKNITKNQRGNLKVSAEKNSPTVLKMIEKIDRIYFNYINGDFHVKRRLKRFEELQKQLEGPVSEGERFIIESNIKAEKTLLDKDKNSLKDGEKYVKDNVKKLTKELKYLAVSETMKIYNDKTDFGISIPEDSPIKMALISGEEDENFSKAMKTVEVNAEKLTNLLTVNGKLTPQSMERYHHENKSIGEGFVNLGSGSDSTVYLHEPTQVIYKVFHDDSMSARKIYYRDNAAKGDKTPKKETMDFEDLQKVYDSFKDKYENINHDKLAKYNLKYIPTYFVTARNSSGTPMNYTVQPYLDESVYYETSLFNIPEDEQEAIGISDLNEGNARINIKTGEIFIIDGIIE